MRGILKKLSIKITKEKIEISFIIFFIILFISSLLYYFLTKPILFINIPEPDGNYTILSFTGYDIFLMTINGILENYAIQENLKNTTLVDHYVSIINNIIEKYDNYYEFYNNQFQKIYPQRYFILCVGESCDTFFFSYSGILRVNQSLVNPSTFLVVWINNNYLNKTISLIEQNRTQNFIYYIKYGLENGYIKIKNDNILIKNIFAYYNYSYYP